MLEKITEKMMFIAPLAAALYCSPASAQSSIKTEEDLAKAMIETNTVYFINHPKDSRKKDWEKYLELIGHDEEIVVKQTDGKTYFGLDGWGQVLDPKHRQRSTENGVLDLSERIPNYTVPKFLVEKPDDWHYAFLGLPLLQQEPKQANPQETYTVPVAIVPVPGPVIEREVSAGEISIGAGYLQISAAEDQQYGFNGQLYGGKAWLTFQPRETNWYFGPEVLAYGNSASAAQEVKVPAKDGPLAGELTLEGTNEYSLSVFGLGTGFIIGHMIADEENVLGAGLELHSGIMVDMLARELTEKSAYYINGNLVEGTAISNTSADDKTAVNMYTELGAKIKLGGLCVVPAVGMRTNFGRIDPLYSMSLGYCPK